MSETNGKPTPAAVSVHSLCAVAGALVAVLVFSRLAEAVKSGDPFPAVVGLFFGVLGLVIGTTYFAVLALVGFVFLVGDRRK